MGYAFDPELAPAVPLLPSSDLSDPDAAREQLRLLLDASNELLEAGIPDDVEWHARVRDEGIIYALRMLQAGVAVELHQFPGTFHGSELIAHAAVSKRSIAETTDVLRRALHPEQ